MIKLNKEKQKILWTILGISMFQMAMVALSPVISSIHSAFPYVSELVSQLATTFLNLVLVIVAVFSGQISDLIGRRMMCIIGLFLFAAAGLCGFLFHGSIFLIYLWSAFLGAGTGLFVPSISSMMVDYFSEEERPSVAGYQTSAVNLGGMVLSVLSGVLASVKWSNAYLVFLFTIPVIWMCVRFLPHEQSQQRKAKKEYKEADAEGRQSRGRVERKAGTVTIDTSKRNKTQKERIPFLVWFCTIQTTVFAIFYFAFSTNISLLLTERNLGGSSLMGICSGVFMFGGCMMGFVFNKVMGFMKKYTAVAAFLLLAVSYLLIFFIPVLPVLMIGAFIGGGSLSVIFPFCLLRIGGKADHSVTVTSTALILSVGPNLGSFLSPLILTNLAGVMGRSDCAFRFLLAAILASIVAIILFVLERYVANR